MPDTDTTQVTDKIAIPEKVLSAIAAMADTPTKLDGISENITKVSKAISATDERVHSLYTVMSKILDSQERFSKMNDIHGEYHKRTNVDMTKLLENINDIRINSSKSKSYEVVPELTSNTTYDDAFEAEWKVGVDNRLKLIEHKLNLLCDRIGINPPMGSSQLTNTVLTPVGTQMIDLGSLIRQHINNTPPSQGFIPFPGQMSERNPGVFFQPNILRDNTKNVFEPISISINSAHNELQQHALNYFNSKVNEFNMSTEKHSSWGMVVMVGDNIDSYTLRKVVADTCKEERCIEAVYVTNVHDRGPLIWDNVVNRFLDSFNRNNRNYIRPDGHGFVVVYRAYRVIHELTSILILSCTCEVTPVSFKA